MIEPSLRLPYYTGAPDLKTVTEHETTYLLPLWGPTVRLNRTASSIWGMLIDQRLAVDRVVADYAQRYRCPADQATEEVTSLIKQLTEGHLIVELTR